MQDSDIDFIVNSLLADCAWGRLEPGPVWIAVGRLATDRCSPHLPSSPLLPPNACRLLSCFQKSQATGTGESSWAAKATSWLAYHGGRPCPGHRELWPQIAAFLQRMVWHSSALLKECQYSESWSQSPHWSCMAHKATESLRNAQQSCDCRFVG